MPNLEPFLSKAIESLIEVSIIAGSLALVSTATLIAVIVIWIRSRSQ